MFRPIKIVFRFFIVLMLFGSALAQEPCTVNLSRPYFINVRNNGAAGDGLTDDTNALQSALNKAAAVGGKVFVPNGIYIIDANKGVQVRSGVILELSKNAVLKAAPNRSDSFSILRVSNASNVTIVGGILLGERYQHEGTTGEWGMGLSFDAASDVVIKNVISKDNWGDGFYIGGGSRNISFCSVVADGNRRQGMSIVYASNIIIRNSSFVNTKGTAPAAGIDIEPNNNQFVTNVEIENSEFVGNAGAGIHVSLGPSPSNSSISDIKIIGNNILENGKSGINFLDGSNFLLLSNDIRDNKNYAISLSKRTRGGVVKKNGILESNLGKNNAINDEGINAVSENLIWK